MTLEKFKKIEAKMIAGTASQEEEDAFFEEGDRAVAREKSRERWQNSEIRKYGYRPDGSIAIR